MSTSQTINATDFKAKCLEILDRLSKRKLTRVIITKRGRAVAVLSPPEAEPDLIRGMHGFLRGSVRVPVGFDLTAPVADAPFDAEKGATYR